MMTEWVLRALFASALIGVAGLAADEVARLLRRPRRWVWAGALAGSVLVPVLARWIPSGWSGALLERAGGVWSGWGRAAGTAGGGATEVTAMEATAIAAAEASSWAASAAPLLTLGWLAASAALLAAFLLAYRRLHRAGAASANARVDDGPPVLVSESAGPAVIGVMRPRVLVPRWVLAEPAEPRSLILAHEREHVAARDPLLLAAAAAALVAMPWNPVLWWQHRRLRRAVETDCDARVLARGADVRAYGRALLETTRRAGGVPAPALAFSKPANLLERRILAMTDRIPNRRVLRLALLAPAAAALAVLACDAAAPTMPDGAAPAAEPAAHATFDAAAREAEVHRRAAAERMLRQAAENRLALEIGERITIRPYLEEDRQRYHIFGLEVPLIVDAAEGRPQPLIYVDGVPLDAGDARIRELDPSEIARIEVVKGALARRMDGPEAESGVIRVFTRAATDH